ncbi:hypothetical protein, partial [Humibacter sp.]|uniref:hypothetical protein n=1 Tax=Humibacter sp. TaxID=1940291 RepID=UPI003F7D09E4
EMREDAILELDLLALIDEVAHDLLLRVGPEEAKGTMPAEGFTTTGVCALSMRRLRANASLS